MMNQITLSNNPQASSLQPVKSKTASNEPAAASIATQHTIGMVELT